MREYRSRALAAVLAAMATTACASTVNPWRAHDATADYKSARADGDRVCPVVVHNGTDVVLEAVVDLGGVDRSLGLLTAGQSATLAVACSAGMVHARAVGQGLGPSEGTRFRKSALLDVMRETRLRFTSADQVRW